MFTGLMSSFNPGTSGHVGDAGDLKQACLDNIRSRVEKLWSIISNESLSLVGFAYELDEQNAAERNLKLEQLCEEVITHYPMDAPRLLSKFRKAKLGNPNPQKCAIVPIRGTDGLKRRIELAGIALSRIREGYAHIDEMNRVLYSNCSKLQSSMKNIQIRHIALTNLYLRILNLFQDAAAFDDNSEMNARLQIANLQAFSKINELYNYGNWQSRINTLKYKIECLSIIPSNTMANDRIKQIDKYQELAIFDILTESSALIDYQREALCGMDKKIKFLEEKLKDAPIYSSSS